MRIRISHQIVHRFAPAARTVNQILRLTPLSFDSQYVLRWRLDIDADGALREIEDAHGNAVSSFSCHGRIDRLTISAGGEIETGDAAGVVKGAAERLPVEMYLRDSPLAHVNGALRGFAAEATHGAAGALDSMHRLMAALHETIACQPDDTDAAGSAVEAFALRRGKARDFAHIFIACARFLGVPARFVAGYRVGDDSGEAGVHEWAEAHVPDLGWVAFDATAPICPDDRYVRVCIGFDGQDGAMTRSAHSGGEEKIETAVLVEQAGAQSQA
ncbi:MAG TPA: transglutaminase family protein [Roseiarcus sp.]|nr:transglutaminase family protein [Roseiarcus sp.]